MLSDDARALWNVAQSLKARADAKAVAAERDGVSRTARDLPSLLFFTDPKRTPRPWETAAHLPQGAGVVFRHFGLADAEQTALRLRDVTTARGLVLLIGLDADLANHVGADGVHLPQRAISAAYALSGKRPDWILTGAVHSIAVAKTARDLDALVLSPIFPAGGRSSQKAALGIPALAETARATRTPVYALGGINAANVGGLALSGACGLAGVDAIAAAFRI